MSCFSVHCRHPIIILLSHCQPSTDSVKLLGIELLRAGSWIRTQDLLVESSKDNQWAELIICSVFGRDGPLIYPKTLIGPYSFARVNLGGLCWISEGIFCDKIWWGYLWVRYTQIIVPKHLLFACCVCQSVNFVVLKFLHIYIAIVTTHTANSAE